MSFLGKNINLVLIGVILLVIVVTVATAVLYQQGLTQRTTDFELTSSNLSQCLTTLDNYRSSLAQKETELNSTSQDIRKYDVLYEQKQAELTSTQTTLTSTQTTLDRVTLERAQFKSYYEDAMLNISTLQRQIGNLQSDNENLRADVSDLQDRLDACQKGGK